MLGNGLAFLTGLSVDPMLVVDLPNLGDAAAGALSVSDPINVGLNRLKGSDNISLKIE